MLFALKPYVERSEDANKEENNIFCQQENDRHNKLLTEIDEVENEHSINHNLLEE